MFAFPVTVPVLRDDGIYPLDLTVNIDDVAVIKELDKSSEFGIECEPSETLLPNSEIIFTDGRVLPVLETYATLLIYLDAYRSLEGFYTQPEGLTEQGNVISLFGNSSCDTSGASTPD